MKTDKALPNPKGRRIQYVVGGAFLYLLGWLFCILNGVLDVPLYQKVSNFTVYFLICGGGLGIITGFCVLGDCSKSRIGKDLWKPITATVVLAFIIVSIQIMHSQKVDPTSQLLVGVVFGAYLLFLYLIKIRTVDSAQRDKNIETAEVLIVAIALAIGIKAVGVQAFKIPSGSMLHTLQIGDHLLVSKFSYGIPLPYTDSRLPGISDPERGDIVVFAYPGYDNPDRPYSARANIPDPLKEQDFIKRIVGLPGDTLEFKGTSLIINGNVIEEPWSQYLSPKGQPLTGRYMSRGPDYGPVEIPEEMYFVMGDNRNHSNDSRVWGFVKKGRIKGNAIVIYWSLASLKRIGTLLF